MHVLLDSLPALLCAHNTTGPVFTPTLQAHNQYKVKRLGDIDEVLVQLVPFNVDDLWVIVGHQRLGHTKFTGNPVRFVCVKQTCVFIYGPITYILFNAVDKIEVVSDPCDKLILRQPISHDVVSLPPVEAPKTGELWVREVVVDGVVQGHIIARGMGVGMSAWFTLFNGTLLFAGKGPLELKGAVYFEFFNRALVIRHAQGRLVVCPFKFGGKITLNRKA
jgi:hypothetical protein